ncbi:MAG: DNRLRE domain-containing protein [Lachnospiraceae bacterium]
MNGVNETNKSNEMITADKIEAVKQEGRSLVCECIKERSRFSRVFETKNGEKAAVIYPKAVHFKKDDAWEAIDNTLVLSKDQLAYENAQGRMKVRIARMPKQTDHKKKMMLFNLEEKQNARSAQQDQTEEKSGIIELASVEKDGFTISWGLKTQKEKMQEEKPAMLSQMNEPEVAVVPVEFKLNSIHPQTEEEKLLKLSKLSSAGYFREILPGMDIRYRLESEVMKEEIILKKKEAATETITFVMKHPGLSMHVLADGSVAMCKTQRECAEDFPENAENLSENAVFFLDAPILFDKNGEILKAAYQIEKGQGISEITIKMDASWLMDEGRAYPVTIDPTVRIEKKQTTIDDAFVRSKDPNSSYGYNFSELEVGRNRPYQVCRTFLKFNTLPKLEKGAVITDARLNLYQYQFSADNGQGFRVSAHEVTGAWDQRTLTWNNQPSFKPEALDYLTLENTNGMAVPKTFDVTKLIRGWYNNPSSNHGIALKAVNENVYATATLVSSDMPVNKYGLTADCYPIGIVYYRSTKGLEDYYSYHEQELGRTGTGYVNRYNGNLVFIHEDEGTGGILMPVSVSHVYNLSDCDTQSRFGKEFRLSLMQELKASGNSDYPYVLTDTDGTNHYFYKDTSDSNKLKDEDGLGLVITQTSSNEYDSYRIMKDKDEVQYVFGQDGYLRQIKDTYGNAMKCQYGPNSAGNYIQYAEDPTGARIVFNYNSDLTKLVSITANKRSTSFAYDAAGHLTNITYPDGKTSRFGYDGDKLIWAEGADKRRIVYGYRTDCGVERIAKIGEGYTDAAGTFHTGTEIEVTYPELGTTVFTEPGLDGKLSSTADNHVYTWKFNRFGSPAEISDNAGHVSTFSHYDDGARRHKLRQSSLTGKLVTNLLKNTGFDAMGEFEDGWGNASGLTEASAWGVERVTDKGYFADTSIRVTKTQKNSFAAVIQEVWLEAGTYTLSAYTFVKDVAAVSNNAQAGAGLAVRFADQSMAYGLEFLTGNTDTDIDGGWKRVSQTFTVSSAQVVTIYGGIFNTTGTAWFDCFQLETGDRMSDFNMVNNGRFARNSTNGVNDWNHVNLVASDTTVTDSERGSCLRITGEPDKEKRVLQGIYAKGGEGDVFRFGCFAKAEAIPGKTFRIAAAVIYADGTHKWENVDFDPYRSGWQYVSGVVSTDDEDSVTNKQYTAVHLYIMYDNQMNPGYFTDVQFMKDDSWSYTYDSKGNLNTAKKTRENNAFQHNSKDQISRMAAMDGTAYDIYYNAQRMPLYAKSAEGQRSYFWYNKKGQPTTMSIEADKNSAAVTVGRVYYIRQQRSGKYIDTQQGDTTYSNIQQYTFNGSDDQKWKVEDAGEGYIKLVSQSGTKSKLLDVLNGWSADGTNIQLYPDHGHDAQKFKLKAVEGGGYQLLAKCSNDEKCVMVSAGSAPNDVFAIRANIELGTAGSDSEPRSIWYFEPADEGDVSAAPQDGMLLRIRARHSGQYVRAANGTMRIGDGLQQTYSSFWPAEEFLLTKAQSENGTDWYYIRTVFRPSLYVDVCSKGADGYDRPTLQEKSDADSQKFCFKKLRTGYVIENKLGYQFDVKLGDYANLVAVIATGTPSSVAFSDIQDNKVFVLENLEKRIHSYMSYTSDFRNVASVTDARQKRVSYAYDSDNLLLTKMTDSNNHSTQYHYEASTDRLTGVSATASGQTRDVSYTYDEGDRIKSIKHGGTTYVFDYDGFGNQTMVKAGDKTLERYGYAPNNGPLTKISYGNGDVQEILYDKEERIKSRRWNGQSTDTVRYEYDAYGSLEKETDLVNGRIDKDQYDMTGRLVQSTTLEKNTGTSGEPIVANTHTVQSLEIGYDSYNRVNRLVQSLETAKTKMGFVYGDASKAQRPGLSYGLTVDGTQRQSLAYDAMARCTKETVTLPGGQKRENCFTYGTLRHLTDTDSLLSAMSNGTESWSYEYDNVGNITKITSGTKVITYQYDELNQLIRENNGVLGITVLYAYDAGGNMTSRKTYAYTEGAVSTVQTQDLFTYRTDGWKDQLLSWNGKSYAYDAGGNPTVLRGMALTWGEGRRLKRIAATAGEVTFAYDSDGKRVRKTSGGNDTTYYYNGNVLSGLVKKASKDAGTTGTGTTVQFVYDTQGKPFMLRMNGKTDYFYLYNGLGDITGLVDSSNQVVVRYQYNSWGKVTSTQDTSGVSLATLNPFCYRKYVYDPETGLYCLGSRYYDPEVGRFVNADDTDVIFAKPQELYHKNLYVYCDNNPVVRRDLQGYFWETIFDIISVGTDVAEIIIAPTDLLAWGSLGLDLVCTIVPGATGGGKAVKAIAKASEVGKVSDGAKAVYKAADKANDIRKATGSYEIIFESGKNYVGKGGFGRSIASAVGHATKFIDPVVSIEWRRAANTQQAFLDEYMRMIKRGIVIRNRNEILAQSIQKAYTYNLIWSPGKTIYGKMFLSELGFKK